jgi:hypothetical protein
MRHLVSCCEILDYILLCPHVEGIKKHCLKSRASEVLLALATAHI